RWVLPNRRLSCCDRTWPNRPMKRTGGHEVGFAGGGLRRPRPLIVGVRPPEAQRMTDEARPEDGPCSPAFPGKVVALWAGNAPMMAVLTACRFERIAGRTFIVGQDVARAFAKDFPGGLTRAIAWDSELARDVLVFDSLEAFEHWRTLPTPEGFPP